MARRLCLVLFSIQENCCIRLTVTEPPAVLTSRQPAYKGLGAMSVLAQLRAACIRGIASYYPILISQDQFGPDGHRQ